MSPVWMRLCDKAMHVVMRAGETLFVFYYARAQKQVRPKEGQVAGKKTIMNREPLGFSVLLAIEKTAMKMSAAH